MKLRAIRNHYKDGKYIYIGTEYFADKLFAESVVKRGICEIVELPKRKNKKHPRTKKGAIEKK